VGLGYRCVWNPEWFIFTHPVKYWSTNKVLSYILRQFSYGDHKAGYPIVCVFFIILITTITILTNTAIINVT
jgi:hypothetical protein